MKFTQVNTGKGLRWHVTGCNDLKKSGNFDQGEPREFSSYEEFVKLICEHWIDPGQGDMTMAQAIKEAKSEFCNCAKKVLK